MMNKPPFCTQDYCGSAQECVDEERCIGHAQRTVDYSGGSNVTPSLDLSALHESIDKACETIDYLREKNVRLEALLRAIIITDTNYQSACIFRQAKDTTRAQTEETVAYDARQEAIEDARKALS